VPLVRHGGPATFYPFFSTTKKGGNGCVRQFGNDTPGEISNLGRTGSAAP